MEKNPLIFKHLYETFENALKKTNIHHTHIAIGVSGGADSIALCLIAKHWADNNNCKITALTVDHQLRKESSLEAQHVHEILKKQNIHHVILKWIHDTLNSKIQEQARVHRYNLLSEFCIDNDISLLCTAHHLDDQIETFMMRLSKGSGLNGLTGIQHLISWNECLVFRPFLTIQKDELKEYLQTIHQEYIEDPSNQNTDFERIRWRNILKNNTDFSTTNFLKTINNLKLANDFIEETTNDCMLDIVRITDNHNAEIDISSILQLHHAISTNILKKVFQQVSGKLYSTAHQSSQHIIDQLECNTFTGLSSGGCVIQKKKNVLFITKDPRLEEIAA